MSVELDCTLAPTETRFRVFPHLRFLPSFGEPEAAGSREAAAQAKRKPRADRTT